MRFIYYICLTYNILKKYKNTKYNLIKLKKNKK